VDVESEESLEEKMNNKYFNKIIILTNYPVSLANNGNE